MYLSLNLSKKECPDESFFSIAFANDKTAGTTLRKPIESIVFPIRNAYYILRRGRSNRYRTTDRYRNEDIVQIILTINRQDISFATALALTIILLSLALRKRTRAIPLLTRSGEKRKQTRGKLENKPLHLSSRYSLLPDRESAADSKVDLSRGRVYV